jgi:WS/DGAT/MGAT family acyltransferase
VLAICTGGLRHLLLERGDELPDSGLRGQIPVNIRSADKEHALGNELTSLFVELPVATADPIARYEQVVARAEELKRGSQRTGGKAIVDATNLGPPVAGGLLARSMFGGPRMFNLTITNVPGPQQRLYALGAPLVEIQPLVPLFAGHTVGIAVISYAGQFVFGLNADAVAVPDLDALAEGMEQAFEELQPRRSRRPRHRAPAAHH